VGADFGGDYTLGGGGDGLGGRGAVRGMGAVNCRGGGAGVAVTWRAGGGGGGHAAWKVHPRVEERPRHGQRPAEHPPGEHPSGPSRSAREECQKTENRFCVRVVLKCDRL